MSQDRTPYQDQIIKRYYKNRDQIATQRISELATELYLAEGKKRDSLWKRAAAAMKNLGLKLEAIEKVVASDDPALMLRVVQKHEE